MACDYWMVHWSWSNEGVPANQVKRLLYVASTFRSSSHQQPVSVFSLMASSLSSFLSPRPSSPPLSLPGRIGPVHLPTTPNRSSSSSLSSRHHLSLSPLTTTSHIRPATAIAATPLISPHDQWGTWTALFATGAFGIWSPPCAESFHSIIFSSKFYL